MARGAKEISDREWVSVYVFHAEPWDELLCDVIHPLVGDLLREGAIGRFFFVRYWEQGPHVRLRVETQAGRAAKSVGARLRRFFSDYLRERPSIYAGAGGEKRNVVELIPYEPETARYGGGLGVRLAERQFHSSSVAVLSALRESRGLGYGHRLQAGVILHLALAAAFGMSAGAAEAFFENMFRSWLWSACGPTEGLTPAEIAGRRESVLQSFRRSFARQRGPLLDLHSALWGALEEGARPDSEWCNRWVDDMSATARELTSALRAGALNLEAFGPPPARFPSGPLWPILHSYVHMTNNRLGILNRDEAFLAYIIRSCFGASRGGAEA